MEILGRDLARGSTEGFTSSPEARSGFSMREWRFRLRLRQGIGAVQLKEIYIGLPLVVVPRELTDALSDDATLAISWAFMPGGMKPLP
jgi:hypothetical protein